MKGSFLAAWVCAALLTGCGSNHHSSSPGGSDNDGGSEDGGGNGGSSSGGPTLYGLCAPGAPEASLGMFVSGTFGFTLPLPAGQAQEVTLTVLNNGPVKATQMTDLTPQSSTLSYKGGTYPGTGGTCGTELDPGATCTLVVDVVAPATGRQTSLVVIQYYDGVIFTTDAHQVEAVAVSGTFTPATHAPLAAMPQNGGQAPLSNVNFVTVSFSDTPEDDQIQAFGDWIVTSSYWLAVGKDYGVGAGTHQHVKLSDATPNKVIDQDFQTYLDQKVASGALPSTPQSVYTFFLSQATTVTDVPSAAGWHNLSAGGHDYAVILAGCSPAPADILNQYTFVASHELAEAATDPAPLSGYDFGFGEGEVGDLCVGLAVQDSYALTTIWSNSAAAKGGDPCVPATGLPYVDVDPSPAQVNIPATAGGSVDVTLTGWSTSLVGDWVLEVSVAGQAAGALTAKLDPTATDLLNNGETVKLTLTTDGSAPAGNTAIVEVASYAPSGAQAAIQGVQLIPVTVVAP
jgi:hypothetical protein